jgi:phytoene desaturase
MACLKHAVVIGSGFGGLAAAIRLGARGYRSTVCERLDAPGGRAYVFQRDGYTFDSGPTIITAPFLLEELWQLCGKTLANHVTLCPLSPFYQIRFDDGLVFDYHGDCERMRAEVARLAPADVPGFERFMSVSEAIYRVGFEKLGHVHFGSWTDMVRIAPAMLRLRSYQSVYQLVHSLVKDPRLRIVLSFHPLLIGGNPFTATSIYALIAFLERRWGVHFAMGGTGSVVRGMVDLIEGQGGEIRYNAEVQAIKLRGRRAVGVQLKNGEEVAADIVVSNADAAFTYGKLLPREARSRWTDRRLARARYSMGLFLWYFGTRKRYPRVAHHTILLGPRYRELLEDIFTRQVLPEDFSLYLHRPTATDPSLAPDGCDAFYVLSPVANLQSGVDWSATAERYRAAIAQRLESTVLPGLTESLTVSQVVTPQDFESRFLSQYGAAFGFEPVLRQSAYFRPHNRSEDIERLFLVGAGTHPGAGIPGVLSSARVLDSVVPHANSLS